MTYPTDEPLYYATTLFSGVGFCLPGQEDSVAKRKPMFLDPAQVDPDVRNAGRQWLDNSRPD